MGQTTENWWSQETIAVVTGGNKGIGYEIVRGLAKQGVTTILTARDESRGAEAVDSLKQQHGLTNVRFHKLDVTSSASADEFASWLKSEFGGFDILVNNAGITGFAPDQHKTRVEAATAVLETNYHSVRRLSEKLIPLMKSSDHGARIINVSSGTSRLDGLKNEALKKQLSEVDKLSRETIDRIAEAYLQDVKSGQEVDKGWPGFFGNHDYCVSKLLLNAYARLLAKELEADDRKAFANCFCPGLTSTDMTSNHGHSAELGAETAIWLALLPASASATGKFFSKKTEVGFTQIPFYMNDVYIVPLEEFEAVIKQLMSEQH